MIDLQPGEGVGGEDRPESGGTAGLVCCICFFCSFCWFLFSVLFSFLSYNCLKIDEASSHENWGGEGAEKKSRTVGGWREEAQGGEGERDRGRERGGPEGREREKKKKRKGREKRKERGMNGQSKSAEVKVVKERTGRGTKTGVCITWCIEWTTEHRLITTVSPEWKFYCSPAINKIFSSLCSFYLSFFSVWSNVNTGLSNSGAFRSDSGAVHRGDPNLTFWQS